MIIKNLHIILIIGLLFLLVGMNYSIAHHIRNLGCNETLKAQIIKQQQIILDLQWELDKTNEIFGDKLIK